MIFNVQHVQLSNDFNDFNEISKIFHAFVQILEWRCNPGPPMGSQLPLTTGLFSRGLQAFEALDGFPWA